MPDLTEAIVYGVIFSAISFMAGYYFRDIDVSLTFKSVEKSIKKKRSF